MKSTSIIIVCLIATMSSVGREFEVQHEKVVVRSAPQPFGKKLFELKYKDTVEVMETKGAWLKVHDSGTDRSGWASNKSFKKSSFLLSSSTAGVGSASATEIAAAGKGFSAEVESGLKEKNTALSFDWVDRMETWTVREEQMLHFLKEGKLQTGEAE